VTKEEIKDRTSMTDLLGRYGVTVNRGMCRCPFHKNGAERHPSMGVWKDNKGVTCFTCGWSGDVFAFVMRMDNLDFKDAFRSLGGTYEHEENELKRIQIKAKQASEKAKRERLAEHQKQVDRELMAIISILRIVTEIYEPLSDEWCFAKNEEPYMGYLYDQRFYFNEGVDELYVHRKYRELRQRFIDTT